MIWLKIFSKNENKSTRILDFLLMRQTKDIQSNSIPGQVAWNRGSEFDLDWSWYNKDISMRFNDVT